MSAILAAWIACQAADAGTTLYALHTALGARETNPIMRPAGLTIRASANLYAIWQYRKARPGQKKTIAAAFAVSGCAAASWNLYQLHNADRPDQVAQSRATVPPPANPKE